jgi:hypothetical protein
MRPRTAGRAKEMHKKRDQLFLFSFTTQSLTASKRNEFINFPRHPVEILCFSGNVDPEVIAKFRVSFEQRKRFLNLSLCCSIVSAPSLRENLFYRDGTTRESVDSTSKKTPPARVLAEISANGILPLPRSSCPGIVRGRDETAHPVIAIRDRVM